MAVSDFHRRQRSILVELTKALVRLLGVSAGKRLTPRQFNDLATVLTDTANAARNQTAQLAFEYYLGLRPKGAETIGAPTLNPLPVKYFEKVIESHRQALESEDNPTAGVTRITQATLRAVNNGSRETVQAATRYDPAAVGWARVLTGAESCGWCAMLASRGPVYNSRKSAGAEDEWHLGCDCIAVPVFRGQETNWDGYAEFKKLERFWIDHTAGKRGKAALRAFDRAFAEKDPKKFSPLER